MLALILLYRPTFSRTRVILLRSSTAVDLVRLLSLWRSTRICGRGGRFHRHGNTKQRAQLQQQQYQVPKQQQQSIKYQYQVPASPGSDLSTGIRLRRRGPQAACVLFRLFSRCRLELHLLPSHSTHSMLLYESYPVSGMPERLPWMGSMRAIHYCTVLLPRARQSWLDNTKIQSEMFNRCVGPQSSSVFVPHPSMISAAFFRQKPKVAFYAKWLSSSTRRQRAESYLVVEIE